MTASSYARWFRDSTPYIRTHRGKTFVVMLGGDAADHDNLTHLVQDLALLSVLGVRLVIVHGARPQIDAACPTAQFVDGRRVTSADDLPRVVQASALVRTRIEAAFSTGLPNTPLHNVSIRIAGGNVVRARPIGVRAGIDHGHTGEIRSVDTAAVNALLDANAVLLLSPLGYSPAGAAYNLEAGALAAEIAVGIQADKLIVLDALAPLTDSEDQPVRDLTPAELAELLDTAPANSDRLHSMLDAVRRGVPKAHLVSFLDDGALLEELFTATGAGTQLSERAHRNVRPATTSDLSGIVELVRPMVQEGGLVERSIDEIERAIDRYLVAEIDGIVVGCCAVLPYAENADDAEIASVAVHPGQRKDGVTSKSLLAAAESQAQASGVSKLWALTTGARDWFVEQGFTVASHEALPADRKDHYDTERNSTVLCKVLTNN